jgi:hypothetical protein
MPGRCSATPPPYMHAPLPHRHTCCLSVLVLYCPACCPAVLPACLLPRWLVASPFAPPCLPAAQLPGCPTTPVHLHPWCPTVLLPRSPAAPLHCLTSPLPPLPYRPILSAKRDGRHACGSLPLEENFTQHALMLVLSMQFALSAHGSHSINAAGCSSSRPRSVCSYRIAGAAGIAPRRHMLWVPLKAVVLGGGGARSTQVAYMRSEL